MDVMEKLVELLSQIQSYGVKQGSHVTHQEGKTNREIASYLIAHGVTVQEWISVKDRLPEIKRPVLVYGGNGITIDWLEDYGELGLRWGNICSGSYKPEYWQPMPQPPKGE